MALIVGTVLRDNSELSEKWLRLQLRYLRKTSKPFKHFTVVNDNHGMDVKGTTMICLGKSEGTDAHIKGLCRLRDKFKTLDADEFLFLDADAFPIVSWREQLIEAMQEREIAIVMRPENLETRLHACVLYAKTLDHLDFELSATKDLMGNEELDCRLPFYEEHSYRVFPLIRSNRTNLHPLLCGIYWDCFYHHGCGSRPVCFRSRDYWGIIQCNDDFTKNLFENPSRFIEQLTVNKFRVS